MSTSLVYSLPLPGTFNSLAKFDSLAQLFVRYSRTHNIWWTKGGTHEYMCSQIHWWIDSVTRIPSHIYHVSCDACSKQVTVTYCDNQCHFNFDLIAHISPFDMAVYLDRSPWDDTTETSVIWSNCAQVNRHSFYPIVTKNVRLSMK